MTDRHLLHRALLPPVRRRRDARLRARGPPGRDARSHGVLSHIRRPAVRHRPPRRDATVVETIDADDDDRPSCWRRRCRRARASPARSTGRGASITCSSTPASTCCRRAFDRLFDNRTMSFHMGARRVDDRPGARGVARRHRARASTKPTASCGRTGRSRSASCRRRKPRRCRCARSRVREGTLRLIEIAGLRSVGLRRHACRAHRRDRAHRGARRGAVPRRLAPDVRLRRPRAARAAHATATPSPAACARCRCCPPSCRLPSSGFRTNARSLRKTRRALQDTLAEHEGARLAGAVRRRSAVSGWSSRRSTDGTPPD